MMLKTQATTKVICIAAMLCMTSATVFTISATPAFAERGGNGHGSGNGRSNGNGRGNQSERSNSADDARSPGNNGRGQLARELGNLNAAHANPNALANASPNSMRLASFISIKWRKRISRRSLRYKTKNMRLIRILLG